jgi:hypothetical protein
MSLFTVLIMEYTIFWVVFGVFTDYAKYKHIKKASKILGPNK